MSKLVINGGKKIFGHVKIASAKNACLPLISATLAVGGEYLLSDIPNIDDISVACEIARGYGVTCEKVGRALKINSLSVFFREPNEDLSKKIRASLFFLGASLARFKRAVVYKPGGCDIGSRPIDIHICGLKALGVKCVDDGERFIFDGTKMHSARVSLRYPSVGATINLIEAAIFLNGQTVIRNAAKEPEITCLCDFLNTCGCKIFGGGSSEIVICGTSELKNACIEFLPIRDRIEAATFMAAVCACGGEIAFKTQLSGIEKCAEIFCACGCEILKNQLKNSTLCEFSVKANKPLHCVNAEADVYPSLATDMQPLVASALLKASGFGVITDKVYSERFLYAEELKKFGANIERVRGGIKISGVKLLKGECVTAADLRGGAALAVAALSAEGESVISGAEKICRGYENFDRKLSELGASAKYVN